MNATAHANAAAPRERQDDDTFADRTADLGMWIFLVTELLFFGALLFAYLDGRIHWPDGFGVASRRTDVLVGTINTAVLLSSSALVALAVAAAHEPHRRRLVARLLYASAALGVVFLALKGYEYAEDWHERLLPGARFDLAGTPGAELFFMLYFFMTSVHALHLAVGVGLLSVFARGSARDRPWANARRIHVAGLYWHFVDVVWIFLYPLIYLVSRHG